MISKKTLKSMLSFSENQPLAPSFILIYLVTWLVWHKQLFSHFISAEGGFLTKVVTALTSIEDNQFFVVFLISALLVLIRLVVNYLVFRSRALLNTADDDFTKARDAQLFSKNDDIANVVAILEKTKQQLAAMKVREQTAVAERNTAIKNLLNVQHELDEAKADIEMLNTVAAN
ncbi:hypothetical protein [Colwellia piezophila]|uniref:hypothetical protein n=1 Tax=Colwellia piezophila TaxID=211668 RepID=UPI0003A62B78|nr:hypothetical protein [Colwellia piezophila]